MRTLYISSGNVKGNTTLENPLADSQSVEHVLMFISPSNMTPRIYQEKLIICLPRYLYEQVPSSFFVIALNWK